MEATEGHPEAGTQWWTSSQTPVAGKPVSAATHRPCPRSRELLCTLGLDTKLNEPLPCLRGRVSEARTRCPPPPVSLPRMPRSRPLWDHRGYRPRAWVQRQGSTIPLKHALSTQFVSDSVCSLMWLGIWMGDRPWAQSIGVKVW